MQAFRPAAALTAALSLSACAAWAPQQVVEPTQITIKQAFADIADVLRSFGEELQPASTDPNKPPMTLGMVPCRIEVTLDLSATARKGGEYGVGADVAPGLKVVSVNVSGMGSEDSEGSRGSQMVIELVGIACLPKDSLAAADPGNINRVVRELARMRQTYDGSRPTEQGGNPTPGSGGNFYSHTRSRNPVIENDINQVSPR